MFDFLRKSTNTIALNRQLVLDVSRLQENERLEIWSCSNENLTIIQKVKLSSTRLSGAAKVITDILPEQSGQVSWEGSLWKARCDQGIEIPSGHLVNVLGRQSLTLLVAPITQVSVEDKSLEEVKRLSSCHNYRSLQKPKKSLP